MISVERLAHLVLNVRDVDASKAFYMTMLGLIHMAWRLPDLDSFRAVHGELKGAGIAIESTMPNQNDPFDLATGELVV